MAQAGLAPHTTPAGMHRSGKLRPAGLLLVMALLCSIHVSRAVDVKGVVTGFVKYRGADIAGRVAEAGVDGISNWIAGELDAAGESEAASAVRESGDVIESAISTAVNGYACYGSASLGAAGGAALGTAIFPGVGTVFGALAGAFIGGAVNPACHEAISGVIRTAEEIGQAAEAVADALDGITCDGYAVPMADTTDCILHCDSQAEGCFTWYMDHGCCLCKDYCDTPGDSGGTTSSTSSTDNTDSTGTTNMITDPSDLAAAPASDTSRSDADFSYDIDTWATSSDACGAFDMETDYYGGDIVPVTTKWADTAVSAATPEDCCEACTLYNYCQAWTFTRAEHCKERLPNAPGCCFLKKGAGWEAKPASDMISGTTLVQTAAQCTLEFDTEFQGGGILTASGEDTVVATFSDADCCQSCKRTPGCGAWTMTPPSECKDRIPTARGCCFLKYATGWTRTKDSKGVLTSGVLLS